MHSRQGGQGNGTERAAILMEHVAKRFEDVKALDNLSLEVSWGELFGLLGPNGAGKTTAINILAGLIEPTAGSVRVTGYDVARERSKIRELIGVCPQDTAVYDHLTGRENVELFGNLHTMPKKELEKSVDELLSKLSVASEADRRVGKYSGGMRRRVNLIMALVHDPMVAFLDEPTVAMDPQSRRAVWEFIRELKERGKTVILTTHYMEEAEELCDRVGIIDAGRLVALGTPVELKRKFGAEDLEGVFIELTGRTIREGV